MLLKGMRLLRKMETDTKIIAIATTEDYTKNIEGGYRTIVMRGMKMLNTMWENIGIKFAV